jgi:hypothetical protein
MTIKSETLMPLEREILSAIEISDQWPELTDTDIVEAVLEPSSCDWAHHVTDGVERFWDRLSLETRLVCVLLASNRADETSRWRNG